MDHQEIKFLLIYLDSNGQYLNSLQHKFIASVKESYNATRVLTKRQIEYLYQIKEFILTLVLKEGINESESNKYPAQYSSFDCLTAYTRL